MHRSDNTLIADILVSCVSCVFCSNVQFVDASSKADIQQEIDHLPQSGVQTTDINFPSAVVSYYFIFSSPAKFFCDFGVTIQLRRLIYFYLNLTTVCTYWCRPMLVFCAFPNRPQCFTPSNKMMRIPGSVSMIVICSRNRYPYPVLNFIHPSTSAAASELCWSGVRGKINRTDQLCSTV